MGFYKQSSIQADPYAQGKITLSADLQFGRAGNANEQFNSPHGIAIAPDGTIYIADTNNNRIQHFSAIGQFINSWGSFADNKSGTAPIGTFNQPWAVAISPNGKYIYVADTWNHRIQKFDSIGTPLKMWGTPLYDPTTTDPFGMWGPRGIAVDRTRSGLCGRYGQQAHPGLRPGWEFSPANWQRRSICWTIRGASRSGLRFAGQSLRGRYLESAHPGFCTWSRWKNVLTPLRQWPISGWYGESLDNKPFIAVDTQGHVFVTDPEGYRVLEFSGNGDFIRTWGDLGVGSDNFGLACFCCSRWPGARVGKRCGQQQDRCDLRCHKQTECHFRLHINYTWHEFTK